MYLHRLSLLLGCSLTVFFFSCDSSQPQRNQIADETLNAAESEGIDYIGLYQGALDGNELAVIELIKIQDRFDAAASLGHRSALSDLRDKHGIKWLARVIRQMSSEDQEKAVWLLADEPAI